ncbi:hypothetical protein [Teichococcus aestuarii]|uniref:hypothetical protein n=1 Tax=Teichococcus aestuarii TaxID=568898 RepID=UPI0036105954
MFVAPFKRMSTLDTSPAVRLGTLEAERQASLLRVPRETMPKQPGQPLPPKAGGEPVRR